jgi:hypothetical protein
MQASVSTARTHMSQPELSPIYVPVQALVMALTVPLIVWQEDNVSTQDGVGGVG